MGAMAVFKMELAQDAQEFVLLAAYRVGHL